jgi:hypothetical protein
MMMEKWEEGVMHAMAGRLDRGVNPFLFYFLFFHISFFEIWLYSVDRLSHLL